VQTAPVALPETDDEAAAELARSPIGRRRKTEPSVSDMSHIHLDYKALLPKRFEVDVAKRYAMDKLVLGEGGYGKVFVARDQKFGQRLVAVKKLTKTKDVKKNEAFHEEVRIMLDLDHPSICRLFETFEQGMHMYFIMEYCEGGEVFNRIIAQGYISEKTTAEIIAQVAAALKYAHSRAIAHRDIKPENIVFCTKDPEDSRVKVIDWGLSTCFTDAPMVTAVGSFAYAAPEVITSKNRRVYTNACDAWSMGVVTYVMLCGKPPFWGAPQDHLRNAAAEKYPMKSGPWATMPEEAISFVRQLLKANPEERMTCADATEHPWLKSEDYSANRECSAEVLQNLSQFSDQNLFMQFCITAVARQLDHRHLRDIHQVFREMDQNGDGTLSVEEIGSGLRRMFGEASEECKKVEELFERLDLNGSGAVDYTEFCAAGLGANAAGKADVVWAAFKAFDLDDNGQLSKSEIQQILGHADVRHAWSAEVCAEVAQDILDKFDSDGDGAIEFNEWMTALHDTWSKRSNAARSSLQDSSVEELLSGLASGHQATHMAGAYDSLRQVNHIETSRSA